MTPVNEICDIYSEICDPCLLMMKLFLWVVPGTTLYKTHLLDVKVYYYRIAHKIAKG